jgi:hypothetical protein
LSLDPSIGSAMISTANAQSTGDMLVANRTATQFVLFADPAPANGTVGISPKNSYGTTLPANTDSYTVHYTGPIRTNISWTFSYRDSASRTYGCDYTGFLNFVNTTGGGIDHYNVTYNAYSVVSPTGTQVTCTAETGTTITQSGGAGADFGGVYFLKP